MAKLKNKTKDNPKLEQRHRKTVAYRCIWNITSVAPERRLLMKTAIRSIAPALCSSIS